MEIKPRKYKKVKQLVNVMVHDVIYGCDECKKVLDMNKHEVDYLRATIHSNTKQAEDLIFCSWKCCLSYLPKIKCDYFVSLPYLMFDSKKIGLRAKDLLKLLIKG